MFRKVCMDTVFRTRLTDNGRMLIPAECRKLLGLRDNEELLIRVDDRGLHVASLVQQLRAFRGKVHQDRSRGKLSDELKAIRAQDAE
jgi:AbrB family looped-hinge helix DNA binding protein